MPIRFHRAARPVAGGPGTIIGETGSTVIGAKGVRRGYPPLIVWPARHLDPIRTPVVSGVRIAIMIIMIFFEKGSIMQRMAARDAKTKFGELLNAAQREPVTIEKHGKPVAVMLSAEDYREFEALKLARLRGEIQIGLDDLAAGRLVDGKTAFETLRARLAE